MMLHEAALTVVVVARGLRCLLDCSVVVVFFMKTYFMAPTLHQVCDDLELGTNCVTTFRKSGEVHEVVKTKTILSS